MGSGAHPGHTMGTLCAYNVVEIAGKCNFVYGQNSPLQIQAGFHAPTFSNHTQSKLKSTLESTPEDAPGSTLEGTLESTLESTLQSTLESNLGSTIKIMF